MPVGVDHLIFAGPDLERAVQAIEARLGVRPLPGGEHPRYGTHNALLALGADSYLEVIGPLVAAPLSRGPRPFQIDRLTEPRLVTWAARAHGIRERVARARKRGIEPGAPEPGVRIRPDGSEVRWMATNPHAFLGDGLVPFLIDWEASASPARAAAKGVTLLELRLRHPEPERVQRMLDALELGLVVGHGAEPLLEATIRCPRGDVVLR